MILDTQQLCKNFGSLQALKNISISVEEGEIFGLVGPDGAGKTTFFRTILGLYLADSGKFTLLGSDNPEKVKSQIGYVPQQFSLSQDLTVWENLSLFGSLYGIAGSLFEERAQELLEMVWMEKFKDRLAGNLSGGMKQKLALVAGLLHRPKLLILDEPTTGVDPVSRREFWQLLYRLNREGLTLILSTPYMDEVELCHKLAFFHQGEIRAIGSPADLLTKYPYEILALEAQGLRSFLGKLSKLPAHDVYLQGENLRIVVDSIEKEQPAITEHVKNIGLKDFSFRPLKPNLEDLFSILSDEEATI